MRKKTERDSHFPRGHLYPALWIIGMVSAFQTCRSFCRVPPGSMRRSKENGDLWAITEKSTYSVEIYSFRNPISTDWFSLR